MKKTKILCVLMVLLMVLSTCSTAFAADDANVVEEVTDAVAEAEAAAAAKAEAVVAAAAAAAEEAAKVNDTIDVDEAGVLADDIEKTSEHEPDSAPNGSEKKELTGADKALIAAIILIALGGTVILLSNRKIKSGKKGKGKAGK